MAAVSLSAAFVSHLAADSALETLLLPLIEGPLAWPRERGALFLRARDGWPLHQRAFPGLVCQQSFKPDDNQRLKEVFGYVPQLTSLEVFELYRKSHGLGPA